MNLLRNKAFIWLWLLIAISAISCTKEIEIDIPREEKKFVINSFFTSDSIIKVHLSRSAYIFDGSTSLINNALIELKYGNEIIDVFQFQHDGIYYSNIKPVANKKYKIIVSNNEFSKLTASDIIPDKVNIISSYREDNISSDEYGNSYSWIKITFQDNPDKTNYYEVILYYEYNDFIYDIIDGDTIVFFDEILKGFADMNSEDPVITSEIESDNNFRDKFLFFKDDLINGQEYKLSINYRTLISPHINENYTIYIYLNSISENYYNYKKKLYQYNQNSDGIWNNSGEVVQIYSNVENGYGIFAAYSSDIDTLSHN